MRIIDSHTEGESTRVVIEGGPDLGIGPLSERIQRFANEYDIYRRRIILEPRGSDCMVGALLVPPTRDDCDAGVLFFNNTSYLGMCGHGIMGVAVTLAYLNRVSVGALKVETPVGVVQVELNSLNEASVENVPSYCLKRRVKLTVDGLGEITGDVAWGGNWFFLVDTSPCVITLENELALTQAACKVRAALKKQHITGADQAEIDHIEFFSSAHSSEADSRNFVLCPGNAYDRSPCGTGTSAKLACLADKGILAPGERWVQESIIGSRFIANYRTHTQGKIIPYITGRAYICGETQVICQPGDPFANGIV